MSWSWCICIIIFELICRTLFDKLNKTKKVRSKKEKRKKVRSKKEKRKKKAKKATNKLLVTDKRIDIHNFLLVYFLFRNMVFVEILILNYFRRNVIMNRSSNHLV